MPTVTWIMKWDCNVTVHNSWVTCMLHMLPICYLPYNGSYKMHGPSKLLLWTMCDTYNTKHNLIKMHMNLACKTYLPLKSYFSFQHFLQQDESAVDISFFIFYIKEMLKGIERMFFIFYPNFYLEMKRVQLQKKLHLKSALK